MGDDKKKESFWTTLPGILTGLAALITAVGGLVTALYATGLLNSLLLGNATATPTQTFTPEPSLFTPTASPTLTSTISPTPTITVPPTSTPTPTSLPVSFPILDCRGVGAGGDRADLRGIQFVVNQDFGAIEVRMAGVSGGTYAFIAELRRSSGFLGPTEVSQRLSTALPATSAGLPYAVVRIEFPGVSVTGSEAFTLRFASISGPGRLFIETFGIGTTPCAGVQLTDQNNVANPSERSDPAGFKLLAP